MAYDAWQIQASDDKQGKFWWKNVFVHCLFMNSIMDPARMDFLTWLFGISSSEVASQASAR